MCSNSVPTAELAGVRTLCQQQNQGRCWHKECSNSRPWCSNVRTRTLAGQAVQHALVSSTKEQQAVAKEVKRAMQQSAALVAASLERLQVAEAAWDRDVRLNGVAVDGFPTVEQVLTFMSRMSRVRERQRMCLVDSPPRPFPRDPRL